MRFRWAAVLLAALSPVSAARAQQPQIAALAPASAQLGGAAITLVIRGVGFVPGVSRVGMSGANLPAPSSVTPTEIRVRVPAEFLSESWYAGERFVDGVHQTSVVVINGPQSDAPSAVARFQVLRPGAGAAAVLNPPVVGRIAPSPAPVDGTITVTGSNFGAPELSVTLVSATGARARAQVLGRTGTELRLGLRQVPAGTYTLEIWVRDPGLGKEAQVRAPTTLVVGRPDVLGAPTVAAVGPLPVRTSGGVLTLTGTNFGEETQVTLAPPEGAGPRIALRRAANQAPSRTSLGVVLPPLTYPGTYGLRVENPGQPAAEHPLQVQHVEKAQYEAATRVARDVRGRPERPRTARPERGPQAKRWNDPSNLDGSSPDHGIYWFRSGTDGLKSTGPDQNDRYYDPSRPTMLYVHGWQQNIHRQPAQPVEMRRESFFVSPTGKDGQDVIEAWVKAGWNVGIFYWDKFADEDEIGPPYKAEAKIWTPDGEAGMRWRKPDGSFAEHGREKSAMDLFFEAYVEALRNNRGPEIRVVGHSLGNQMAVRMVMWLSERGRAGSLPAPLPQRVALLDPYWSAGAKPYLNGQSVGQRVYEFVGELRRRHGIVFEQYQTSILNHLPLNDANEQMQGVTAYVRLHPHWLTGNALEAPKMAHVAAIHWYFSAFATGLPVCDRDPFGKLTFSDRRAPSAAMPTDRLKAELSTGVLRFEQKWGELSGATDDDCVVPI